VRHGYAIVRDLAVERGAADAQLFGRAGHGLTRFGEAAGDLAALMALAAQGKVTLHTAKYALGDFQDAIDDLSNGRVRGRAILTP
jgi:hypothetical protein